MDFDAPLTPKNARTITRSIKSVLSKKGLTIPQTIDDYKALGPFPIEFDVDGRKVYVTPEGRLELKRISDIIHELGDISKFLSYDDVFCLIVDEIQCCISNDIIPDANQFLPNIRENIKNKSSEYSYICKVSGIELTETGCLEIGSKKICKFDESMINDVDLYESDFKDRLIKEYSGSWVLTGIELGSQSISIEKFHFNSELCLALINVHSTTVYENAIYKTKVQLVNDCSIALGPASTIGCDLLSGQGVFSRYFKDTQDVVLNDEVIKYFKEEQFFDDAAAIIEKTNKSELEEQIIKSLHWFRQAHLDKSPASKWIKLWSCLECFFTFSEEAITESNARGIASILVFGGYAINNTDEYSEVKGKVKKFYKFRSKIVHNADYIHIDQSRVSELSNMVAWIIITCVSLVTRGYTKKSEIKIQSDRLDKIASPKTKSQNDIEA